MSGSVQDGLIGVIGLGNMGSPVSRTMIEGGYHLMVFDRDPGALNRVVACGAKAASSVEDVARNCPVISIVVVNDEQVNDVGETILAEASPDTTMIVFSTVRTSTVVDLAEKGKRRGIHVIDAGLGGSSDSAERGRISLMIGGEEDAVEHCWPLFETIGRKLNHLGPTGSGLGAKLVNNLICVGEYALQLEAMELGAAYGLEEDTITSVLSANPDHNGLAIWGRKQRARRARQAGGVDWSERMGKDLFEAVVAGGHRDVSLPLTGAAAEMLPFKLRQEDRMLDAIYGENIYPELPRCAVCGFELSAAYRERGVHPHCALDEANPPERRGSGDSLRDVLIGVVGLGNMGTPISRTIIEGGFPLVGYDRDPSALARIVALGGDAASSIEDLARRCRVIAVAVVNDEQVNEVGDAVLGAAAPGSFLIIHSTVRVSTITELARRGSERGIAVMDAGLGGTSDSAERGRITLMIGGEQEAVEYCWPLFETIGRQLFHLGPVGSGVAAKLVNNIMSVGGYALQLEAMQLATTFGLDEETVTRVVVENPDHNGLAIWGRNSRARRARQASGVDWSERMGKDLFEAALAGGHHDVVLPLTAAAAQMLPLKLRREDRRLDGIHGPNEYPELPRCRICGFELAAPYRSGGVHPHCALSD